MKRLALSFLLVLGLGLCGLAGLMAVSGGPGLALPGQGAPQETGAGATQAPRGPDPAAVETAWRGWMDRHGVTASAMALGRGGAVIHAAGQARAPDLPYPVASLSKAITALCLNEILAETGRGWDTTLGDIADALSQVRVTPPPWSHHITLAQLVTHTSGMAPDLTQGDMVSRLHGSLGLHRRIAWQALQRDALRGTPGTHVYSNTNYAMLGTVAEALSGQDYATACRQRITAPAGADGAVIEGAMGSMSSYAGWEISATDYARIALHWFAPDRPWVADPDGLPHHDGYGLGAVTGGRGQARTVTHNGRLCSPATEDHNIGALFLALGDGAVFTANWQGCLPPAAYDDLLRVIRAAMR